MNLIARCPACQTSYKVVPDQLHISDGWVRCGQCGEVFDASPQLTEAEDEPAATAFTTADSPAHQEALSAYSASEMPWTSTALLIRPAAESEAAGWESVESSSSPLIGPVSFMRVPGVAPRVRPNSRPLRWWAFGVALLLGLLFQLLYRERDLLATRLPALKPAFQSACEALGCRVSALNGIENLAIDSATFHQVGPETFALRFVVKSSARHAVALPAIELTLTDLADQPVMRRVFTPAELGVSLGTVASGGEWSATTYLRIRAEANSVRAQGYRLLIFYP